MWHKKKNIKKVHGKKNTQNFGGLESSVSGKERKKERRREREKKLYIVKAGWWWARGNAREKIIQHSKHTPT